MQFSHRIPVAMSGQAQGQPLTCQDLWSALLHGLIHPKLLRPDLDHVEVRVAGPDRWHRRLVFGQVSITEELIAAADERRVTQRVLAPEPMVGGSRSVTIEADDQYGLCLCFCYDSPHISGDASLTEAHRAAFRAAYAHADAEQLARLLAWIANNRANGTDRHP